MVTVSYLDRLLEPLTEAFTPKLASILLDLRADPEVEQIVSRQHGGTGDRSGLALAYDRCNAYRSEPHEHRSRHTHCGGLFNPRGDAWSDHFALRGGRILGLTPKGRAAVRCST
jgi:hypothetical protein